MLRRFAALALALVATAAAAAAAAPPGVAPSKHIAKIMAHADGASAETAYKVGSIREEYEIVRALGLEVESQALVEAKKKPYDVLTVRDPRGGGTRALWFAIGSFYPEF
jgi:hypothetical protein